MQHRPGELTNRCSWCVVCVSCQLCALVAMSGSTKTSLEGIEVPFTLWWPRICCNGLLSVRTSGCTAAGHVQTTCGAQLDMWWPAFSAPGRRWQLDGRCVMTGRWSAVSERWSAAVSSPAGRPLRHMMTVVSVTAATASWSRIWMTGSLRTRSSRVAATRGARRSQDGRTGCRRCQRVEREDYPTSATAVWRHGSQRVLVHLFHRTV